MRISLGSLMRVMPAWTSPYPTTSPCPKEAAALSRSADDLYKIREIHKHIHRAQTYLWVLEDSLKLNDH